MNCSRCSTENPEGARFCLNCGLALSEMHSCANCQTELPANARFCFSCGQPVDVETLSDEERRARLAAAAPSQLAEKAQSAPHVAGERRVVTSFFMDVVGSTALAEQLDPEDWTSIMNRAFDRLSPIIYKYEGTIARLLGDAILAFFGAPVAHEDDPVRAVHAALDILDAAQEFADEIKRERGIEFAVRVGLNTGPVVVGEVGSNLKYEYTAMGDAVNLAARMEAAARPMTVLISEYTYRFVAPVFDVSDLGPIDVKGKSEPVRVYEVRAPKAEPGRLRGLAGLESPMVGRDKELQSLVQASSQTQAGLGRAALVIGEPGLGKSRLIAEWKAAALSGGDNTFRWVQGNCLSYGQGLAYHLVADALRALVGVSAAASEEETRAALQARTADFLGDDAPDVFPYLAHMLSLTLEGEALERVEVLDPQVLQARYKQALEQLVRAMATQRPLVMVCDDIHWADPSSTDLLVNLVGLASEVPLLLVAITRPEPDSPGWKLVQTLREQMGERLAEVSLNALTDDDSRQLVSNLLEIEALPEHIRDVILKKSEGNPFFVEEVIRMLIDREAIRMEGNRWVAEKEIENVEIPDNLQGLLLARIDRLPDNVKHTLRVASVIGRQFPVSVLEQVLRDEAQDNA